MKTLFQPKIKVKFVDADGFLRRAKKYPIAQDGETVTITKVGGAGNPNPKFNPWCVRKKKNHFLKVWKPGVERWIEVIPGAKHAIEFKPRTEFDKDGNVIVHPADPALVQFLARAKILSQWGDSKDGNVLFYANIGLSVMILLFMFMNSGVIRLG
jgi:hypothetical protein